MIEAKQVPVALTCSVHEYYYAGAEPRILHWADEITVFPGLDGFGYRNRYIIPKDKQDALDTFYTAYDWAEYLCAVFGLALDA